MNDGFAQRIRERMRGEVREKEPMAGHTSFGIGGPADIWAAPQSREDLIALLDLCESEGLPHTMIGRGTNLLVRDGGVRGVVITLERACANMKIAETRIIAGAAISLGALAKVAAKSGLKGLEFCAGIPGSVGGALVTNAGAWGESVCKRLDSALVYDPKKRETRKLDRSEIEFGYRKSNIASFGVTLEACFALEADDPEAVSDRMKQYMTQRGDTQPVGFKSSGCVFKNPPGGYAGALIDALGFKGHMRGGAMVSDVHANFIVNTGAATAADVLAVMDDIKKRAQSAAGIELEEEIEVVGLD
jgi:UDP-N-acetylmuramate dehydrogenase